MNKKIFKKKFYEYGEQNKTKNKIKLNANENFCKPNIELVKNIIKEINFFGNILKYYPKSNSEIIKKEISKFYNIEKKNLFIGNGSDDILSNIFITFFKNKKILYLIDLTYSFYESFIKLYKIKFKTIKIRNFLIDLKKIKKNNNLIINNPNAPTGKFSNNIEIKIISKNLKKSIILIDETYIDFECETIIKKIKNYKNTIIVQTFSKSRSAAGLRVGFAICDLKLIWFLENTKNSLNSYPVNILSQISIKNIFKYNLYFKKTKKINKINKNFITKNLKKLNFKIIKSKTNFILLTKKNININKLLRFLIKKNIFLRKFENFKIENFLRLTIGNKKDCEILINNFKKYLQNFN